MEFKVIGDRLIVRPSVAETKSPGGIIIPDAAVEKLSEGSVVTVGPDVKGIEVGDHVFYGKYSGTKIPGSGKPRSESEKEELVVMRIDEIIAYQSSVVTETKVEGGIGG